MKLPLCSALILASLVLSGISPRAQACTSFALDPKNARGSVEVPGRGEYAAAWRAVTAESFDWYVGDGYGVVLPRGRQAAAFSEGGAAAASPARWVSRFGSLAFTPVGPGFTVNGVNEAGLSVMVMQADAAVAGTSGGVALPAMSELEWPQYILDTSETVAEALARSAQVRVAPLFSPLQYLVCDVGGACAVFEPGPAGQVSHSGAALPVAALANSPYAPSLDAWNRYQAMSRPKLPSDDSLARFVKVSLLGQAFKGIGDPVEYAFYALSAVHQPGFTRWNMVFDRKKALSGTLAITASFRTSAVPTIKSVDVLALDLSCSPGAPAALSVDFNGAAGALRPTHFSAFQPGDQDKLDLQNLGAVSDELQAKIGAFLRVPMSCAP